MSNADPALPNAKQNYLQQQKNLKANLKAQKEAQESAHRQDSRRTALQLAERCSKDEQGQHESDPLKITANAEILYRWLIADKEVEQNFLKIFMQSGYIHYKDNSSPES